MEDVMGIISLDIIIGFAILVAALVFVYTIGKDFAVTINLAVYLAFGTMTFVPLIRDFSMVGTPDYVVKIVIFVLLLVIFSLLQIKNGFFEPIVVPSSWESSVFAVVFVGITATVLVSFLPAEMATELSPYTTTLFLEQPVSNVWFLLPVALLLFIRGDA